MLLCRRAPAPREQLTVGMSRMLGQAASHTAAQQLSCEDTVQASTRAHQEDGCSWCSHRGVGHLLRGSLPTSPGSPPPRRSFPDSPQRKSGAAKHLDLQTTD